VASARLMQSKSDGRGFKTQPWSGEVKVNPGVKSQLYVFISSSDCVTTLDGSLYAAVRDVGSILSPF
jgi:hypothetical protein